MGRTKSYELVRAGKFPCKVIPAGRTYRVVTAHLLRVLGADLLRVLGIQGNSESLDTAHSPAV
ncbi:hypothetical protein QF032_007933 [Streptomyces achromogenes]|uniref:hypothetical protein n=1 Tax=Streptomyces achromogenes TaxID=67255 RepID=UPI00277F7A4A|nr:hypothetical protein [Streptomyces achromogenes]MDQ0836089.1 hypothetical protein [Streptomyces achromogenes]